MNLFSELYNYLYETYFSPDLSAIQNFETYDIERFLPFLVVGLCAGVFFAVCSTYYVSHYLGKVVRKLYSRRVFSPDEALTLDELELNEYLIRRSLYKETIVSKYVKSVEELSGLEDTKTARFYIEEEKRFIADKRFKESKLGIKIIFISFFICFFACFGLLFITPEILQLADNVITMIKG